MLQFSKSCLKILKKASLNGSPICHFFKSLSSPSSSSFSSSTNAMNIFDRKMKLKQREYGCKLDNFLAFNYLKEEVGFRIADRLYDIKKEFPISVELSSGTGFIASHLTQDLVKNLFICDSSKAALDRVKLPEDINITKLILEEEALPFKDYCIDAFISNLTLHWINKLSQTFSKILKCLTNDGVFIGSVFGGQTLFELRTSLQLAETEREGGFGPHISPFLEPNDLAIILTSTGFNMITIDTEEFKINYPSMFELLFDLQDMGESNVSWNRRVHLKRDSLLAAASIYSSMYGNSDGSIPATYYIYYFIGWKPDESQAKPAKRGSANFSFKDLHKLRKESS